MGFEQWPQGDKSTAEQENKENKNFESLNDFRKEAGTLNARQFEAVGFDGE